MNRAQTDDPFPGFLIVVVGACSLVIMDVTGGPTPEQMAMIDSAATFVTQVGTGGLVAFGGGILTQAGVRDTLGERIRLAGP